MVSVVVNVMSRLVTEGEGLSVNRRNMSVGVGLIVLAGMVATTMISWGGSMEGSGVGGLAVLEDISIQNVSEFRVSEYRVGRVAGEEVVWIESSRDNTSLHARVVSADRSFASDIIDSKIQEIKSLYVSNPAPYAGVPSKKKDCASEFEPSVEHRSMKGQNYTFYSVYADAAKNMGACTTDAVVYQVRGVMVFCSDARTVYHIEQYVPAAGDEFKTVINNVRCT